LIELQRIRGGKLRDGAVDRGDHLHGVAEGIVNMINRPL
jgi:hypothetical protein